MEWIFNPLLRVQSDDEGWDVDNLLANSDVPLPDEDTGMVDGLGESACQQGANLCGVMGSLRGPTCSK